MAMSPKSPDQFKAVLQEVKEQTDRGAGIVVAALVEDALRLAIERRMVPLSKTRMENLFGRFGPIATFSTKTELGMALGLYDDNLRKVLNMIRDVRNAFAHQLDINSFDHPDIAKSVLGARTPSMPKMPSVRATFDSLYLTALLLLHAIASAETISIKPVGETHPSIFANLALAVHALQQQQASGSREPPKPPWTAQQPQKPPQGSQ